MRWLLLISVLTAFACGCGKGEHDPDGAPSSGGSSGGSGSGGTANMLANAGSGGVGGMPPGSGGTGGTSLPIDDAGAVQDANVGDTRDAGSERDAAVDSNADYAVGTRRIEVMGTGARVLPVQLWYPAAEAARAEAEAGRPMEEFEPAGARRTQLEMLVANAPEGCTTKTMHAADAPQPLARAEAFPLIVMSHCHVGMRYGLFSVAEQLASLGFVVVAPDHVGDTMYDQLDGTAVLPLAGEVDLRSQELTLLLDTLLDAGADVVPDGLRGKLDAQRVGVVGHSIGSITSGQFSWSDARVRASVFIAAPPTTGGLLGPAVLSEFDPRAMFLRASEDNGIPVELNDAIVTDYMDYPQPAWLADFADAGHYAFSDLCGIIAELGPGCGDGMRQTDPLASFTYLDPELVRDVAAILVSSFFERTLLDRPAPTLDTAMPDPAVTLSHHE